MNINKKIKLINLILNEINYFELFDNNKCLAFKKKFL